MQTIALNDRLQMTSQDLKRGTETLQRYEYGYGQIDASGNLDASKNNGQLAKIESYIGANKQWTQKFLYDWIGRLSEAQESRGDTGTLSYKQKFDYDRFGNLYRRATSNSASGQENPLPYVAIEDSDISKLTNRFNAGAVYDDAGNVTQDTKFRSVNLSYDANGRVFRSSNVDNTIPANTIYDAGGQRVATHIDGLWTFYVYDVDGKLVAEYGGAQPFDEGGVKYVMKDWQGSSRGLINSAGFAQSRTDYTAFGEEINAGVGQRTTTQGFGANNDVSQKYALTKGDKATGLKDTWFRKLESQAGRWTSPDPYNKSINITDPQSFNRYAYVSNQPTNLIDPTGLVQRCHTEYRVPYVCVSYSDDTGTHTECGDDLAHAGLVNICEEDGRSPQSQPGGGTRGGGMGAVDGHRDPRINHDDWVDYEVNPFDDCSDTAGKIRDIVASLKLRWAKLDPSDIGHVRVFKKEQGGLHSNLHRYSDKNCDDDLPEDQRLTPEELRDANDYDSRKPRTLLERLWDTIPALPHTDGPWIIIPGPGRQKSRVLVIPW